MLSLDNFFKKTNTLLNFTSCRSVISKLMERDSRVQGFQFTNQRDKEDTILKYRK